jgi:NADH-quinone oxidoreductase subunit J
MMVNDIAFLIPALIIIGGVALLAITRNLFYAALYLMVVLLAIAALFVLLGSEYVAVSQVVVYVGGVLILLIFGILLTNRMDKSKITVLSYRALPAVILCIGFLTILWQVISQLDPNKVISSSNPNSIATIGVNFLTTHLLVFEMIGLLLLVALVGAASIIKEDQK